MKEKLTPILFFLIVLLTVSCSKKTEDPISSVVSIAGFAPVTGPFSTLVTINGTGFSTQISANIVKFNSLNAIVKSASATQLVVEVPKSSGSGHITVQVKDQKAEGGNFEYVYTTTVSTFAGSGIQGFVDGALGSAQFNGPHGIAFDSQGNLYVAEREGNRIRKITTGGQVTILAGSGVKGFLDGPAATAKFSQPYGVTVDASGNVYVADLENNRIRKISTTGIVSTLAGSGVSGYKDEQGAAAMFSQPMDVAADAAGNIFVPDLNNHCIRKITPAGLVSTFAGTTDGGFADGTGAAAKFYFPSGINIDSQGNIYVGDADNKRVRKITPSGLVTTIAGSGANGLDVGDALKASFIEPNNIAADLKGNVYVSDVYSYSIRKISATGVVSIVAGTGKAGFLDGPALSAQFNVTYGLATDAQGNIFVADQQNHRIRKITIE